MKKLIAEKEKWKNETLAGELKKTGERKADFSTASGIPVKRLYSPIDMEEKGFDYLKDLNFPGSYPFTRGKTPTMYRSDFWIFGQYAGFGTPEEANKRYKYLMSKGSSGLSVALDLPTQIGLDSDHDLASGEVGKVGVAIDSLKDIEDLFDGISLDKPRQISTTANSMGPVWAAMLIALGENQGVSFEKYNLRLQNDSLKEFISRGTYIFPPGPSLKLSCDVIEYFANNSPGWFPITISGYHIREAGATAAQEVAFTMANAIAYIEEILSRGLSFKKFGPQLSVFLSSGMDLFEEIAKFRAMRRVWSRIIKERFKIDDSKLLSLNLVCFTAGSTLTAQQPYNNLMRVTIEALASVLGGCQSLLPSSMDEALCTPTEKAVTLSLRTQQILAYETNIASTVDPLGGSYFVETLTSEIEERVLNYLEKIDEMGGAVRAIENGFFQKEISEASFQRYQKIETGEDVVVGVNKFVHEEDPNIEIMKTDSDSETRQVEKLRHVREERNNDRVKNALGELKRRADRNDNLILPILE
ncbi:MAG: methylmalonyl-CoA mutase, partial [Deltaproteobacteria bacterium]|nr:methylmalonyl-CoA mutase [Deltaproteobacteria bacterium]